MRRLCKFGLNVSNTLQDVVLTMFLDAHTDARTNKTKMVFLGLHYIGRRHKNCSSVSSRNYCTEQVNWQFELTIFHTGNAGDVDDARKISIMVIIRVTVGYTLRLVYS